MAIQERRPILQEYQPRVKLSRLDQAKLNKREQSWHFGTDGSWISSDYSSDLHFEISSLNDNWLVWYVPTLFGNSIYLSRDN